jgi:hypothetical protein
MTIATLTVSREVALFGEADVRDQAREALSKIAIQLEREFRDAMAANGAGAMPTVVVIVEPQEGQMVKASFYTPDTERPADFVIARLIRKVSDRL